MNKAPIRPYIYPPAIRHPLQISVMHFCPCPTATRFLHPQLAQICRASARSAQIPRPPSRRCASRRGRRLLSRASPQRTSCHVQRALPRPCPDAVSPLISVPGPRPPCPSPLIVRPSLRPATADSPLVCHSTPLAPPCPRRTVSEMTLAYVFALRANLFIPKKNFLFFDGAIT